ncbi:MAG TPA: hypothetical protein VFM18_11190, partial [Methanosarcina sp.]|nr:hypothetical protein [Methanosarcina sp.]
SILPPPPIGKKTSLIFDSYFGVGFVQGKENAYADKARGYTTPHDSCPYPDPPYTSYCKGYHEAYYFNWNNTVPKSW